MQALSHAHFKGLKVLRTGLASRRNYFRHSRAMGRGCPLHVRHVLQLRYTARAVVVLQQYEVAPIHQQSQQQEAYSLRNVDPYCVIPPCYNAWKEAAHLCRFR